MNKFINNIILLNNANVPAKHDFIFYIVKPDFVNDSKNGFISGYLKFNTHPLPNSPLLPFPHPNT